MKALSLHQPWASLMASGHKRVETRSWALRHRGPLLIHAAKKWNPDLASIAAVAPFRAALEAAGIAFEATEEACERGWGMPFGAIIGRVDVVDCVCTENVPDETPDIPGAYKLMMDGLLHVSDVERAFGDYSPGRFAFVCENAVRFAKPIPYSGCVGLFDVPDELLKGVM